MSADAKGPIILALLAIAFVVVILWPVLRGWIIRGPVLAEREHCARLADSLIWEYESAKCDALAQELERDRRRHNQVCQIVAREIRARTGVAYVDR